MAGQVFDTYSPMTIVDNMIYQPDFNLMDSSLAAQQERFDTDREKVEILNNAIAEILPDSEEGREVLDKYKADLNTKVQDLTSKMVSDPLNYQKYAGEARRLQAQVTADLNTGLLGTLNRNTQTALAAIKKIEDDKDMTDSTKKALIGEIKSGYNTVIDKDRVSADVFNAYEPITDYDWNKMFRDDLLKERKDLWENVAGYNQITSNFEGTDDAKKREALQRYVKARFNEPDKYAFYKQQERLDLGNYFEKDENGNVIKDSNGNPVLIDPSDARSSLNTAFIEANEMLQKKLDVHYPSGSGGRSKEVQDKINTLPTDTLPNSPVYLTRMAMDNVVTGVENIFGDVFGYDSNGSLRPIAINAMTKMGIADDIRSGEPVRVNRALGTMERNINTVLNNHSNGTRPLAENQLKAYRDLQAQFSSFQQSMRESMVAQNKDIAEMYLNHNPGLSTKEQDDFLNSIVKNGTDKINEPTSKVEYTGKMFNSIPGNVSRSNFLTAEAEDVDFTKVYHNKVHSYKTQDGKLVYGMWNGTNSTFTYKNDKGQTVNVKLSNPEGILIPVAIAKTTDISIGLDTRARDNIVGNPEANRQGRAVRSNDFYGVTTPKFLTWENGQIIPISGQEDARAYIEGSNFLPQVAGGYINWNFRVKAN